MKKKNNALIWFIVILLIVFGTMLYFYFKPASSNASDTAENIREVAVDRGTIEKTITGSRRGIFQSNREVRIKYVSIF